MSAINLAGNITNPKVIAVFDPPSEQVWNKGKIASPPVLRVFKEAAIACGFGKGDMVCLTCSPPIPEDATSEGKISEHLMAYREDFLAEYEPIKEKAKLVMYFGNHAGRVVEGHAVQITKARGKIHEQDGIAVLPMLSCGNVLRRPETKDVFESDFRMAMAYREAGWRMPDSVTQAGRDYKWCMDLSEELDLDNPPEKMWVSGTDSETAGGEWYRPDARILTVQLSWKDGQAIAIPLDIDWWNNPALRGETSEDLPLLTPRLRMELIHQLRKLLSQTNVGIVGANPKYDCHFFDNLKIDTYVLHDVVQLAFVIDDNMQEKSLAECVRRWLPDYAGYSDSFDRETDKGNMQNVHHDKLLPYACGDSDACRQVCKIMVKLAREDAGNYGCYQKVQLPALRMFQKMERIGLRMSREKLTELVRTAGEQEQELRSSLISRISPKMKRTLLEDDPDPDKALSFGRATVVSKILFSPKSEGGLGLIPTVFTKTTAKLAPEDRVPSTSAKDHLVYFESNDWVRDLIDYKRLQKLRSTYIGKPASEEYIAPKLLKSGKAYTKKIQEALDEAGVEATYEEATEPVGELTHIRDTIHLDEAGVPWIKSVNESSGFWSYLSEDDRIHPGYNLHAVVTGRTSTRNPSCQNLPKRGRTDYIDKVVKAYRRCFISSDDWVLLESDLSQAEIRISAWVANETTMLDIYGRDGDIHEETAAVCMGISIDEFRALPEKIRKLKRYQAKAVNFGYLYGMGWKGFQTYAKTDYGIDYSDKEAMNMRNAFFSKYSRLEPWHKGVEKFVKANGYVRSLHGALRRLPAVFSTDEQMVASAVRQGINSPIQRFASDLGLLGMVSFGEKCPWDIMRPIAFVHDAVYVEARRGYEEEAASAILYCMENVPLMDLFGLEPPLPLRAEVAIGDNLADMDERKDLVGIKPEWY